MIWSSYIDWDKLEAPLSIQPLVEVKLEWYNTNSEANLSLYILSASISFSRSNKSNMSTANNDNHNIAIDMSLENTSISTLSSLFSGPQTSTCFKSSNIVELEQLV